MSERFRQFLQKFRRPTKLHVAFDNKNYGQHTVVMLHGIAASSLTWGNLLDKINFADSHVIALDLLGFGQSPAPKHSDYSLQAHARSVHATLKKLKIKQPFTIVGHSMGSLISVHYMHNWPHEVSDAVLVSMPIYINNSDRQSALAAQATKLYKNAYTFFLTHKKFTIDGAQTLRKLLKLKDGIDVRADNWQAFSKSLKNAIQDQNTYQELKEINQPISLIYGSLDEFAVKGNTTLVDKLDNISLTTISGADHAINDKMARAVAEQINRKIAISKKAEN